MKNKKLRYIIIYDKNIPFMTIPTYDNKINKNKIINNYCLNKNVVIKIEDKDKFIGW